MGLGLNEGLGVTVLKAALHDPEIFSEQGQAELQQLLATDEKVFLQILVERGFRSEA